MQHWDHHHDNVHLPWDHHHTGTLPLIPLSTPQYSLFSQLTED
jgi:hypothetical protein